MALSTDQLSDMQADLGISDDESVFTDAELNRLFTRADGDYDTTVAYALRQLWAQAWRFRKYTQGKSSEDKTVMRSALKDALDYWSGLAGIGRGTLSSGSINLGIDQEE